MNEPYKKLENEVKFELTPEALRVTNADRINYFFDGADTYGATTFRCLPQFFFFLHLPNKEHDNNGLGLVDGGISGPILAAAIAMIIIGAGITFMMREEERKKKSVLTDEIILAHYSLEGKRNEEIQKLIDEQQAIDNVRIDALIEFAKDQANKDKINEIIKKNHNTDAKSSSRLRNIWEAGTQGTLYFAYSHWILWMLTTLALYQFAGNDYGINEGDKSHSDAPPWFTDDELGFETLGLMKLGQVLIPFIFAVAVVGYYKFNKPAENNSKTKDKLEEIRKYYIQSKIDAETNTSQTLKNVILKKETFVKAQVLTAATTGLGWMLLSIIAAWPLQVFVMKVCNYEDPEPSEYIPAIFAVALTVGLIQAYLKVSDIREKESKILGENTITVRMPTKKGFCEFWKNPEHHPKARYIVIGSVFGSGGFLLSRALFNEGILNGFAKLNEGGEKWVPMDRTTMLYVGAVLCILVMALKLTQYKAETERNDVIAAAEKKIKPKSAA